MSDEIRLTRFLYVDGVDTDTKLRTPIIDTGITVIGKNAFGNDKTVQRLLLPSCLTCIEEKALKNCMELQVVEFNDKEKSQNYYYITDNITEESTNNKNAETLVLQYQSFKDCVKLHTVIFAEKYKKIIIEKEVFSGCTSLRSVVFPKEAKIEIADDAFYGLGDVVFVTENKDVERFAREYDFHCVKGKLNEWKKRIS